MNLNKECNLRLLCIVTVCMCTFTATAQRDTTRKPAIDITSAYKPVLRNAVKINFSGSQLNADTSRPRLTYKIPAQNLFYAYQPIALKPLALAQDTNLFLGDRNYIKAGFGSYSTPYVNAGFSFGDGKTNLLNLYGSYISSKGNIAHQDYSRLNVKATGSFFTPKYEIYGAAGISNENYNLYGYDHSIYEYNKKEVQQQFNDLTFTAGLRNTTTNNLRINYDPNVRVNFYTNGDKVRETNILLHLPVTKAIGQSLTANVGLKGEFTNYTTVNFIPDNLEIRNNLVQLSAGVLYAKPLLNVHAGVIPAWNNGEYAVLPNMYFEAQIQEKVFMLQGGWVGRYIKNTYRHLTSINPYVEFLRSQDNTKETELYGGIKATLGNHFNVNAKVSFLTYNDMPLFINDTSSSDSKAFVVSNEPTMNNFRIHGDISYISQDKFTLNAGFNLNGYTGLDLNNKAWNTIPLEITGSLRWLTFKKLLLKSDLYVFGGGNALIKGNEIKAYEGGFDLSAGAEYKINKQFSAWLDVNNILNDKYERWHRYPVYGINLLGGILIHF